MPVGSSLSVDDVVTRVADKAPGDLVNFSGDEDEGVGGFFMRTRMVQGAF